MVDPNDELLPLFLAEAEDRLERLMAGMPGLQSGDPTAVQTARRELHALKGASRMMGLLEVSELCHRAETVLERPGEESAAELTALLDRVAGLVASSRDASLVQSRAPAPSTSPPPPATREPDLRVGSDLLDRLADGAATMRVLTASAGAVTERLFELARLAESGVADPSPEQVLATLAAVLRSTALEVEEAERRLRVLVEQQAGTLQGLQLQPARPVLQKLGRHARELARSLAKDVRVEIDEGGGEIDRRVLHAIDESLLHLVRNAVSHGIESLEERRERGKPAEGRVRLAAHGEGGRFHLEVSDDGRGIDPAAVVEAAVRRGVTGAEEAGFLDRAGALQLLFRPGMTTREAADDVSGRGVGLDAVAESVRAVGGEVAIESRPGVGTTFRLVLPAQRQGDRIVVVTAGTSPVGIPATAVAGYIHLDAGRAAGGDGERSSRSLARLLGVHQTRDSAAVRMVAAGREVELAVGSVLGVEDVVLRPLPANIGASELFTRMATLASGRPVAVVSPARVVRATMRDDPQARGPTRPIRVLLADDSPVTREMLRGLLEEGGFEVITAADGDSALRTLADTEADCVVTDIEMPGIDGLELTRRLRASPAHAQLPVIVVSTRNRPEDHRAGLEAGADAYLAKQGLDPRELVALVRRLGSP